jgi:hypothetical protein
MDHPEDVTPNAGSFPLDKKIASDFFSELFVRITNGSRRAEDTARGGVAQQPYRGGVMRFTKTVVPIAALLTAIVGAACSSSNFDSQSGTPGAAGDGGGVGDGGGATGYPFEPVGPITYVPKVKNLLTGLPATDAEVQEVVADPTKLTDLINTWMALPQFQGKMVDFFRNAFQQNHASVSTLMSTYDVNFQLNGTYQTQLERNIMDSYAKTAWDITSSGQPFNSTITSTKMMMTTAMMSYLSYVDENHVDDTGKSLNRLGARNQIAQFTVDPNSTATLAQTLDPTNANYMIWNLPMTFTGCASPTPVTTTFATAGDNMYSSLMSFLFGVVNYPPCAASPTNTQFNITSQFAATDYSDWREVNLHVLNPTDTTSPVFYDVLKLRAATDLSLHTARIGFFGTPGFDANWATNASNEMRVTANQALIVSIGQSIDGENTLVNFPVNASDADHASNPACAGCHSQLDPFKQYFRQSYTLFYHDQQDATQMETPAGFAIDGLTQNGGFGVQTIASTLSTHPRYALAWVGKLHFWANSTAAREDDPEVLRIAAAFQASNYDFKTLVRQLFASPLITLASETLTTGENGVILSIARRDQYCDALSNRLGLIDVCGMTSTTLTSAQNQVASRAVLIPADTYFRAYALPALPTNPDLFFRESVESMCGLIASQVVDVPTGTSRYLSTNPGPAMADMVTTVMGLVASDPRTPQATNILNDNFAAAKSGGADASDALKSTFTLACIAPTSVIVGL